MPVSIVDVVPQVDSAESDQNSEPSIAVNPTNWQQMIVGSFGGGTPYFLSLDGGSTWSPFGTLVTSDKTIAWALDGSMVLTATLPDELGAIDTYSETVSDNNFGSPINHFVGNDKNDQPWIITGPNNQVDVAYNDLGAPQGKTASVLFSVDGGSHYTSFTLDRVGAAAGQDDPAVRLAGNGNTVYAVFDRWNTTIQDDSSGARHDSQLIVLRSDDGGADGFTALGAGGNGVQVASNIAVFADKTNTSLTLGQERIAGGDIAIAVDPNNANNVVVAYTNAPGPDGAGVIQLVVAESTNGGQTWTQQFTTSSSVRSGQPGLTILSDGAIGLLYNSYDPSTNQLSQHLVTTTNDFATTNDITLATESNSTPVVTFMPYQGDFFNLVSLRDTFYGVFSASNADNGTLANISNVSFLRDFSGTPGTSSFQLTDSSGHTVTFSIDPFFLTDSVITPAVVQNDYFGIVRLSLPLDQATTLSTAFNNGTQTEFQYVNTLLTQVANTSFPAVAVEGSMYGEVGSSVEITSLVTQFVPAQVIFATQHGFNPQVYASEALGLAFAFGNETGSTGFATAFGPSNPTMPNTPAGDATFAAAAASAIYGTASTTNLVNVLGAWVANWKAFYTSTGVLPGNPHPTADQIDLAARGAAWGDAVGTALTNNIGPLSGHTTTFLQDAAQGIAVYSASLTSQPNPGPFQGATPSVSATPAESSVQMTGISHDHTMV